MQIEKLCIDIYPRSSWQAMDLGCQMAVRWWWTLTGYWLVLTLPIFIICLCISLVWGPLIFWWFKPYFERGLLYILSRQVFGEQVTVVQALKALPSQIKPLWFSSITWRRISPFRGFNQPVIQLEGLHLLLMQKRLTVLHRNANNNSVWWFIICAHWEVIITIALGVLVIALAPQGTQIEPWSLFFEDNNTALLSYALAFYISILFIAPFFVAGSFAIYLNRRVHLEGWDIELGFKRIVAKKAQSTLQATLIGVFLTGYLGFHSSEVWAQENQDTPSITQESEAKQQLHEIMRAPPFSEEKTVTGWRWKHKAQQAPQTKREWGWLQAIIKVLANSIEAVLWVFFACVIGFVLWQSRHAIMDFLQKQSADKSTIVLPDFVTQIDIQSSSAKELRLEHLLANKQYRRLLSTLLVLSLQYLCEHTALELTASMTENECLVAIKKSAPQAVIPFMAELLAVWIKLAWAHITPEQDAVEKLYLEWQRLFALAQPEQPNASA